MVLNWKTLPEVLHGVKPDYSSLKVFGSLCYCANVNPHKTKLEPCASKCIYLGLASHQKGAKVYDIEKHQHFVSRDVVHYEQIFPFSFESFAQPTVKDLTILPPKCPKLLPLNLTLLLLLPDPTEPVQNLLGSIITYVVPIPMCVPVR